MNYSQAHCLPALLLGALLGLARADDMVASSETRNPPRISADKVARELANPNTPLARLTLKSQWIHWDGDLSGANRSSGTLQFQPSFPFPVRERQNIFFRPSASYLVAQPVVLSDGRVRSESGFADIGYDLGYGYATRTSWQALVGVVGSVPSGASALSSDAWTLGPEFAIVKITKLGVYGVFPSHAWDVHARRNSSLTSGQPVAVFFLGGGWTIGTAGMVKYDWVNKQWTVPVNLGVSRTLNLGRTPWKFGGEANYYVERSDSLGTDWMIGFNISPVVPNIFARWIADTN